jgi:hypothetical protein
MLLAKQPSLMGHKRPWPLPYARPRRRPVPAGCSQQWVTDTGATNDEASRESHNAAYPPVRPGVPPGVGRLPPQNPHVRRSPSYDIQARSDSPGVGCSGEGSSRANGPTDLVHVAVAASSDGVTRVARRLRDSSRPPHSRRSRT